MAVEGKEGLARRLEEHARYFDRMVSLIPPKYYFPYHAEDNPLVAKHKYAKNVTGKAPEQLKKETSKKAHKAKLDPNNVKTVTDWQKLKAAEDNVQSGPPNSFGGPREKSGPASMGELRKRLEARIEDLRKKRQVEGALETGSSSKKQKKSDGEALQGGGKSKPKPKGGIEKIRDEASAANGKGKHAVHNGAVNSVQSEDNDAESGDSSDASDSDIDENIQFGTFDFSSGKPIPTYLAKRKGHKKQQLGTLLKKVEQEKAALEELGGTEEGKKLKEEKGWATAMKRASGAKLRDDPKRIKQSMKKQQKMRVKSAKQWKERGKQVAQQQQQRVQQRTDNIADAKRKRKEKKTNKKGRAGFEGKKLQK